MKITYFIKKSDVCQKGLGSGAIIFDFMDSSGQWIDVEVPIEQSEKLCRTLMKIHYIKEKKNR